MGEGLLLWLGLHRLSRSGVRDRQRDDDVMINVLVALFVVPVLVCVLAPWLMGVAISDVTHRRRDLWVNAAWVVGFVAFGFVFGGWFVALVIAFINGSTALTIIGMYASAERRREEWEREQENLRDT